TVDGLRQAETEVLGKRSALAALHQALKDLPPEERRVAGQGVNEARDRLTALAASRREELERVARASRLAAERIDLTEIPPGLERGHLNLVTQTRDELEDVFIGMGYAVAEGPEVDTDFHCFDAL